MMGNEQSVGMDGESQRRFMGGRFRGVLSVFDPRRLRRLQARKLRKLAIAAGVLGAPVCAWAVLYTWNNNVSSGIWRNNGNWVSVPGGYPDDANDDAKFYFSDATKTVEIHDDCIDEFVYEDSTPTGASNEDLILASDGTGPRTLHCTSVKLRNVGVDDAAYYLLIKATDEAKLTTKPCP